jgi:hypothetical protein
MVVVMLAAGESKWGLNSLDGSLKVKSKSLALLSASLASARLSKSSKSSNPPFGAVEATLAVAGPEVTGGTTLGPPEVVGGV